MAPAPAPKRCSPTALGILYGTHDTGFAIAAGRHVALLVQLSHVQVKGDPGFFGADHNRTNETWARAWALAIAQLQDMLPVTAASSEAIGTAAGTRTLPGSGAADDAGAWGKGPRGALVFDTVAVHTYKGAHMPALPDYVRGRQWNWRTNHHEDGHAPAAFYDSPFETALVLSLDGAGNDGSTVVFRADRAAHSIAPVARAPQSVGLYYYCVWRALKAHWSMRRWQDMAHWEPMNYAALGSPDTGLTARLGAALHKIVKKVSHKTQADMRALLGTFIGSVQNKTRAVADFCASAQAAILAFVRNVTAPALQRHRDVEGIVLTGGVAANHKLAGRLLQHYHPLPVHLPQTPGDAGIPLGVLHQSAPCLAYCPSGPWRGCRDRRQTATLGLPVLDRKDLPAYVALYKAARGGLDGAVVLELLLRGLVRGRQETGVFGLGHRSAIALPSVPRKAALLALGGFKAWEPIPCTVAAEAVSQMFPLPVDSPYMSFSVPVRTTLNATWRACAHHDGAALVQTVTRAADPWLHALLGAVRSATGAPLLFNVPLRDPRNRKDVLTNRLRQAFEVLEAGLGLDWLVVDDWVFRARNVSGLQDSGL